jgi:hypothetical protein
MGLVYADTEPIENHVKRPFRSWQHIACRFFLLGIDAELTDICVLHSRFATWKEKSAGLRNAATNVRQTQDDNRKARMAYEWCRRKSGDWPVSSIRTKAKTDGKN